jgi:hypothetical protein
MNTDQEYYSRRAREERERAARCDDTTARLVHLEMASRYSARLNEQKIIVSRPRA